MIFIWTSNGGPLHYLALATIVALQFLWPTFYLSNENLTALVGMVTAISVGAMTVGPEILQMIGFIIFIARMVGGAGGREATPRTNLSQIVGVVAAMPVEEYVADSDLDKCPTSQLKKMIDIRQRRRNSSGVAQHFVERRELIDAVRQCRKSGSSDSCVICFEEYNAGDPLRVLPRCGHEFHLECIDQWAYTFATSRDRREREPSCPLCNVSIVQEKRA